VFGAESDRPLGLNHKFSRNSVFIAKNFKRNLYHAILSAQYCPKREIGAGLPGDNLRVMILGMLRTGYNISRGHTHG
jgi:hypothetical protein